MTIPSLVSARPPPRLLIPITHLTLIARRHAHSQLHHQRKGRIQKTVVLQTAVITAFDSVLI